MGDQTTNTNTPAPEPKGNRFVNYLAIMIIVLSAIILILLIAMVWAHVDAKAGDTSYQNTKDVIAILLPVIGTWMGTILAFYFSKENFEAANKRVQEMVSKISSTDEKLQVLKVSDVMITPGNGSPLMVKDEAAFNAMLLGDLLKKMKETNIERMPVLQDGTLKLILFIYRTTVERFIILYTNGDITPNTTPIAQLTVGDMLNSNFELIKSIKGFDKKKCFLPVTATLDQVKKAMQDNSICQDVFITKTGSPDEAIIGWITNNIVIEKAELFQKTGM